jgi:tetrahydromethanopterin S-methyltransferase subunit E
LTSTFGLQVQIRDAEAAAQGQASYRARKWGHPVFVLFFVEGIAFIAGVVLIIAFCWLNLTNLEIAIRRL